MKKRTSIKGCILRVLFDIYFFLGIPFFYLRTVLVMTPMIMSLGKPA